MPVRGGPVHRSRARAVSAGGGAGPLPAPPGREPELVTSSELLRAEHLTKHFKIGGTLSRRTLHAVDDVSFAINELSGGQRQRGGFAPAPGRRPEAVPG